MNSEDYPRTNIVTEIPPCGSLGGKNINDLPPDTLNVYLNVKQANQLKEAIGNLVDSCLATRIKERQAGVDAIHLINTAIAETVQFITPHRTVADYYDEIDEDDEKRMQEKLTMEAADKATIEDDDEDMPPDPDLPLDIEVVKLPDNNDVDIDETEEQFFEWFYNQLCIRTDEPEYYSMRATNVCDGIFGTIEWVLSPASAEKGNYEDLQVFLNGKPLYFEGISRREVLDLFHGLGIHDNATKKEVE